MTIISTITEKKKEKPFPKLMVSGKGSFVVLFVTEHKGVTLTKTDVWEIGETSVSFDSEEFTDFEGSITLSNGE